MYFQIRLQTPQVSGHPVGQSLFGADVPGRLAWSLHRLRHVLHVWIYLRHQRKTGMLYIFIDWLQCRIEWKTQVFQMNRLCDRFPHIYAELEMSNEVVQFVMWTLKKIIVLVSCAFGLLPMALFKLNDWWNVRISLLLYSTPTLLFWFRSTSSSTFSAGSSTCSAGNRCSSRSSWSLASRQLLRCPVLPRRQVVLKRVSRPPKGVAASPRRVSGRPRRNMTTTARSARWILVFYLSFLEYSNLVLLSYATSYWFYCMYVFFVKKWLISLTLVSWCRSESSFTDRTRFYLL